MATRRVLVLLGGPTGVGKSTVLEHLVRLIPDAAVVDADDVWRVGDDLATPENREHAIANPVSVIRGYIDAGAHVLVLAWVFARRELYGPVIEALANHVDEIRQVYLVASEQTLAERLAGRGDEKLEYSLSRLRLINELPFDKLDTDDMTPQEVAMAIKDLLFSSRS